MNRFIENGLKKGENSVYLTHGDVKVVENDLKEYGIDVDFFKRKFFETIVVNGVVLGDELLIAGTRWTVDRTGRQCEGQQEKHPGWQEGTP